MEVGEREILCSPAHSSDNLSGQRWANSKPGVFSCLLQVQELEELNHPVLLSQATGGGLGQKWSIWGPSRCAWGC